MIKKSKSTGDKPRRKGKVGGKKQQRVLQSKAWDFKPKLKNEAIVLHSILGDYDVQFYEQIVMDIRKLITSLIRNHGFTDGPKRYNILKNYTIDLIEFKEPENPGWLSTSEVHRVPSKLGINCVKLIVDYLTCTDTAKQNKYYQAIITILNISRIVEGLVDADWSSISDKAHPINESFLKDFSTYVEKRLDHHGYDIQRKVNLSSYKINFKKSGPNGRPKLESAPDEAVSLLKDKQLAKPFRIFCDSIGIPHLPLYVSALSNQVTATRKVSTDSKEEVANLRKLVTIPDSGMKTRVVAIVDFWTQLALEPFRDHVQDVTKKLYGCTDFRLNQDAGVASMVDFQKRCLAEDTIGSHQLDIKSLKFYDISSWTDRYHRDLQKVVVAKLFGSRLSQAWAQLVVHCPWQIQDSGRIIKYGQGQGMGTNGSFDVATLTDHLLINFMYDKLYSDASFTGMHTYGKVGDDLWIYDPEGRYPEVCKEINLPINFSKSKEFCKLGSVAEFCSRTFINGSDVSRISPRLISRSKDFRYLPLLLAYCASRGIQLNRSSFPYLENNLKENKDESYFDKLQPWIISVFTVSSSISASMTLDYLKAGNWLTDHTEMVLRDQATILRITLARNITSLVEFYSDIKVKTTETIEAEGDLSMEDMFTLSLRRCDYFDLKSPDIAIAKEWFKTGKEVLEPKQIFVLNRFLTQNHLITDKFYELYALDPNDINYTVDAKDLLEEISTRSVYDRGNINYDSAAYISMQFSVVKVLQRFDEELKTLHLNRSDIGLMDQLTGQSFLDTRIVKDYLQIVVDDPLSST